jgi:hypothetical protein
MLHNFGKELHYSYIFEYALILPHEEPLFHRFILIVRHNPFIKFYRQIFADLTLSPDKLQMIC